MNRVPPAVLLLLALLPLSGCGPKVATRSFEVVATPDANLESPVAVDLVLVRTDALLPAIASLTAREWFASREQLARDHPEALVFHSWEFVPGRIVEVDELPFGRSGVALLVFADYLSEGVHRLRVDPMREFRLVLRHRGFEIESDPTP